MNKSIHRSSFEEFIYRVISSILKPSLLVRRVWQAFPIGSFKLRLAFDVFSRPHYAYGMFNAAHTALALGVDRISVIEFGVGAGDGLFAMESIATEITRDTGVAIEIYGFDTGEGLPMHQDYRDLPYVWRQGDYKLDEQTLKPRLQSSKLVIGDVRETVPAFIERYNPAPIGFVAVDLDFYRSTVDALKIMDHDVRRYLPRVNVYFDDIIFTNKYIGELLAIEEFNVSHNSIKIAPIYGITTTRFFTQRWNAGMFAMHHFTHPQYETYVGFR